jgi:hypothetical protein
MDLIKGLNNVFIAFFLVLFDEYTVVGENIILSFKYEDCINNKWFLLNLDSDYHLEFIDMKGEKTNCLLDDVCIRKELQSFSNNKTLSLNFEKHLPYANSDITEELMLEKNEQNFCFLFYDNYIPIDKNKHNKKAIILIKKLLTFVKRNNEEKFREYPAWLCE